MPRKAKMATRTAVKTSTATVVKVFTTAVVIVGTIATMTAFGSAAAHGLTSIIQPSLTVKLAPDSPAAQTITAPAQDVDLAHYNFILTGSTVRLPVTKMVFNINTDLPDGHLTDVGLYNAQGTLLASANVDEYHHTVTFQGVFPITGTTKFIIKADITPDLGYQRQVNLALTPTTGLTLLKPSAKFKVQPTRPVVSKTMKIVGPAIERGEATVSLDTSSPIERLLAGNSTKQTLAVFRLTANDVEDLDLDSMKITDDGGVGNDTVLTYYFYSSLRSDGQPTSQPIATLAGGATAEFHLNDNTVIIPRNSYVLITVKADMSPIDGVYVMNGDAIETTVAAAGDIDTTGLTSGEAVDTDDTSIDGATHKLYKTYPTFTVASDSPAGDLPLDSRATVAKFNVTAAAGGDLTFEQNDGNTLTVQLSNYRTDDAVDNDDIISLYDNNGTLLDRFENVDFDQTKEFWFDFSSASFTVPSGQTKSLIVKITSQDYEDIGDVVQVWLDNSPNDVDWGIDGSRSYNEGRIIFRGDIFANNLYRL